ncbi:MAG: sugar ABC transporter permease [Defluviitaleaceae bacterium]|nr:sugar ABC transporter permease [Defluviitaleaceae bacterium]
MSTKTAAFKPPSRKLFKRNEIWGWLFAGPAIIGFLGFTLGPMIASIYLSMTDSSLGFDGNWIGMAHYARIFTAEPFIWISVRVTLTFVAIAVPMHIITAFFIAVLLNTEGLKGLKYWRTIAYVPSIVPGVASMFLWRWIMNPRGLLNAALESVGIPGQNWFFDEFWVLPAIAFMGIWGIGGNMVIYLAGLQGVPRSYYDAIEVDGGGIFSKFRYCTLPMMTPVIFFTIIMGIIGGLQTFIPALLVTEGGPNNASLFYGWHIYRTAFINFNMSYAAALSWIMFLVILAITAIVFATSKHWVYYEGGESK